MGVGLFKRGDLTPHPHFKIQRSKKVESEERRINHFDRKTAAYGTSVPEFVCVSAFIYFYCNTCSVDDNPGYSNLDNDDTLRNISIATF